LSEISCLVRPGTSGSTGGMPLIQLFDHFLDVRSHRAEATYGWYKYRLQRFSDCCSLPHSWATNALRAGANSLTVAILMGHQDPSTLSIVILLALGRESSFARFALQRRSTALSPSGFSFKTWVANPLRIPCPTAW
jgi:integrase